MYINALNKKNLCFKIGHSYIRDLRRLRQILDTRLRAQQQPQLFILNSTTVVPFSATSTFLNKKRLQSRMPSSVYNTKTHRQHHITPVLKSFHWLKSLSVSIAKWYLSLQPSNLSTLLHSQLFTTQPPRSRSIRSSSHLSLSRPPVSSSLKFCNRSLVYAAPALWNELPKESRQFAHPPISSVNLTSPPLVLSSATFHSRLKTSYPILILLLRHHTTTIITDYHR